MEINILQMLILQSYTNGNLDEEKVIKIASVLNRRQLKEYIKALKTEEKKRSIYVAVPQEISKTDSDEVAKLFPKKKVIYNTDPSLLAGIKIQYNDDVFELSLKKRLDDIVRHIAQDL